VCNVTCDFSLYLSSLHLISLMSAVNCSICWFGNCGRLCMVVLILRTWSSAAMERVGKLFSTPVSGRCR
jgi:hypothetical protein